MTLGPDEGLVQLCSLGRHLSTDKSVEDYDLEFNRSDIFAPKFVVTKRWELVDS